VTKQSQVLALLTYLVPLVGPLGALGARRDDSFVRYHAYQALAIDVVTLVTPLLWAAASWLLAWIPTVGMMLGLVSFALVLAIEVLLLAARVLGVARSLRGEMRHAPLMGARAERLFYAGQPLPPAEPEPVVEEAAEQPPVVDVIAEQPPEAAGQNMRS